MKQFQAQLRGRPARARRSFTQQEWEQFMELVWELDDPQIRLCASAYFPFMLHFITQLDDASKTYVRNLILATAGLLTTPSCPRFVGPKMSWRSETVHFSSCLEQWTYAMTFTRLLVFGWSGGLSTVPLRRVLEFVIGLNEFVLREVGLVGTHCICKFAVLFARGQGCVLVS
jgi:hypothetical protein